MGFELSPAAPLGLTSNRTLFAPCSYHERTAARETERRSRSRGDRSGRQQPFTPEEPAGQSVQEKVVGSTRVAAVSVIASDCPTQEPVPGTSDQHGAWFPFCAQFGRTLFPFLTVHAGIPWTLWTVPVMQGGVMSPPIRAAIAIIVAA
jgi:hypothetical protein